MHERQALLVVARHLRVQQLARRQPRHDAQRLAAPLRLWGHDKMNIDIMIYGIKNIRFTLPYEMCSKLYKRVYLEPPQKIN